KLERQEIMSQPANGQPAPTMAAGGRQDEEVFDPSTEAHVQAGPPNDQFHRAGQSPEQPSA
ncbi:MAG TPA: hypothetical protein VEY08_02430, partial [Chloroflexia bacterium]|nr:hypothetical protein [Chloroflexia bacterium]